MLTFSGKIIIILPDYKERLFIDLQRAAPFVRKYFCRIDILTLFIYRKGSVLMYNINLYTKDLYVYRGSTFDGSICLEDIHGEPFCISEGDEIILYIEKAIKNPEQSDPFTLTLNNRDEVCGRYPFKLEPEITEAFSGDYYYYIYIRFADGDYYQIVPYTPLHACIPYGVINYCENKNLIRARVPRVMAKSGYEPAINEIMEMITNSESGDITESVQIKHIKEADIIVINNNSDITSLTPSGLVGYIKNS